MRNGQVGGFTGDVLDPRPVKAARRASASGARSADSLIAAAKPAWTSQVMLKLEIYPFLSPYLPNMFSFSNPCGSIGKVELDWSPELGRFDFPV